VTVPYKGSTDPKKKQVAGMFDHISSRYDFLNHALSFNIDRIWRRKAIKVLGKFPHESILDVATGTGDFAIEACKINPKKVTGIDISEGMLKIGKQKAGKKQLSAEIDFKVADSENLPFENGTFDAAIVAFGVRNFESPLVGLSEILRVLKHEGHIVILEFSKPESTPFKQVYRFYFRNILPMVGRVVSRDKSAYSYLFNSVDEFPSGETFIGLMLDAGFVNNELLRLTFGIATIYCGQKPKSSS
jgi:demethylmenaquinone methyltransferase / 2-methoxy-6-polyprenyl-1,4-benzoquinol methylase